MATMLSGVMMLRYLNEETSAARLESAIASVILEGRKVTYDLKADPRDASAVGTNEVAEAVIEKLQ
jgi:isocitrate dehydrogenase (NAD+)